MPSSLVFKFPMPLNIANGPNAHWRSRHGQKIKFWAHCDDLQRFGILPAPPAEPYTRATIASVMHLGHAMDDDNAMRRHKWVLDWLRTRGYVRDDKKKNLRWASFPEQRVGRKQDYTIVLTLTPEVSNG